MTSLPSTSDGRLSKLFSLGGRIVRAVHLLLPALFPSWRFFDVIAPSPRVELALLAKKGDEPDVWRPCRARPRDLTALQRVSSFFWNARWNETLYIGTCAERLMQNPTEHSVQELRRRLRADLKQETNSPNLPGWFRFRLVFVSRQGQRLRRDVAYLSPPFRTEDPSDR